MRRIMFHLHAAVLVSVFFVMGIAAGPTFADPVRGPYLQQGSDESVTVRWRTAGNRDALVRYGTDPANLDQVEGDATVGIDHSVTLSGLSPDTRYYYRIGDNLNDFESSGDQYFDTHPAPGTSAPTRIWVLGDSGTANANAAAVRNAYLDYNGGPHVDVWLMLGDNAYNDGTDAQYQAAVFDLYPQVLRNSILWPTLGNHDGYSADSSTQSGPYYDIFTLPENGESGGMGSGTEAYYSFDYANIHFVSLDSYDTDRSDTGVMANWLRSDLSATNQEWIIAFWHHPPYSKGSHNSDTEQELIEMRTNFLPLLESFGVDLVLGGHSHSYERSMLINGHYGSSNTFDSSYVVNAGDGDPLGSGSGAYTKPMEPDSGAVYTVAGSSGKITNARLNHPVMISNWMELGSMIIDVNDNQLDAVFLNSSGVIRDSFSIVHEAPPTSPPGAPDNLVATTLSATELSLSWNDNSDDESGFDLQRSTDQINWTSVAAPGRNVTSITDNNLESETTYHYRIFAENIVGSSPASNTASATTAVLPPYLNYAAVAETPVTGAVLGNFSTTVSNDGNVQSITESESGGKPTKRRSLLEHRWQFSIQAGTTASVHANAWSSGSSDGDKFEFSYSSDSGSNWQVLFTVDSTDSDNQVSALLPTGINGPVLIRVIDTDRTQGHRALDTIHIDELRIQVSTVTGNPPIAPDGLETTSVTAQSVGLKWNDKATDESGYAVERSTDGGSWISLGNLAADSTSMTDTSVSRVKTYDYRVLAFNAFGNSPYSETLTVTTASGILLTATGQKIKGVIHANLSWGFDVTVDIYRDGYLLTNVKGTSYIDNTGVKGGATFVYKICDSTLECSNDATVAF